VSFSSDQRPPLFYDVLEEVLDFDAELCADAVGELEHEVRKPTLEPLATRCLN